MKKIHIAGSPELKIEGTPVYLDIEGLPDRDFYYLIGVRIRNGDSVVQHSLWADEPEDEAKIYAQFLDVLKSVEKPVLLHYGSFETVFFEQMEKRYGLSIQVVLERNGNQTPVNLLSIILGQVLLSHLHQRSQRHCLLVGFRVVRFVANRSQLHRLPV